MAKNKKLNLDIKEAIQEMSKAPGGNVARQRPVTPGPILGGPPQERKPGVVDPATGVRTKSDTALELFRFYAYGNVKERNLPEPPPDTKQVTVRDIGLQQKEKIYRKTLKKDDKRIQPTQEYVQTKLGWEEGTVGGMTRPIGSKPSVDLNNSLLAVAKKYEQMAKLREEAEVIRDAVEKAFGAVGSEAPEFGGKYTPELEPTSKAISREEQKYLDLIQRRIQDAMAERNAALAEAIAQKEIEAGTYTSEYERNKTMKQAEQRTLEGRQVGEKTRQSRAKTETSMKNIAEKVFSGKIGTGLASLDFLSLVLSAKLMYEQMLLEQVRMQKQIY